jgi:hypothetical protein
MERALRLTDDALAEVAQVPIPCDREGAQAAS